jgi:hypothetical protein
MAGKLFMELLQIYQKYSKLSVGGLLNFDVKVNLSL